MSYWWIIGLKKFDSAQETLSPELYRLSLQRVRDESILLLTTFYTPAALAPAF